MALIIYPADNWDSFCSVADADAILTTRLPSAQRTTWDALADTDKEILLRQASEMIRLSVTLPSTAESDLQKATAYLANYSVGVNMTNDTGATSGLKRKRIEGVIEKEWFNPTKTANSFPDNVVALLTQYGYSGGGSFRFERA